MTTAPELIEFLSQIDQELRDVEYTCDLVEVWIVHKSGGIDHEDDIAYLESIKRSIRSELSLLAAFVEKVGKRVAS